MSIKETIRDIRSANDLTNTNQEINTGELLGAAAEKILSQKDFFDTSPRTVGIEAEFALVDSMLNPIHEDLRNEVINEANRIADKRGGLWSFQPEMGASQIEANQSLDAILTIGFSPQELVDLFSWLDSCLADAAHNVGVHILNLGLHPTADLEDIERTSKEKYVQVPNHHIRNRLEEFQDLEENLGILGKPDATAVGLSQALQFNISAESFDDGVEMLNHMIQMSPSMLAITGNARFVEGFDTGWNDTRNMIWDHTHMTSSGSRVFLPENYFEDVEDVFEHMARFPMILNPESEQAALGIATGTNWLAGKLKFITNDEMDIQKMLVEFRPMSIQQSPEANAAATMLAMGRLLWAVQNHEPLMDFSLVQKNAATSMKEGLDGVFSVFTNQNGWKLEELDGEHMREVELHKAIVGLVKAGHGTWQEIADFFDQNLSKQAPSKELIQKVKEEGGIENRQVLKDALIRVLSKNKILI